VDCAWRLSRLPEDATILLGEASARSAPATEVTPVVGLPASTRAGEASARLDAPKRLAPCEAAARIFGDVSERVPPAEAERASDALSSMRAPEAARLLAP
jgi:hypothetical protein